MTLTKLHLGIGTQRLPTQPWLVFLANVDGAVARIDGLQLRQCRAWLLPLVLVVHQCHHLRRLHGHRHGQRHSQRHGHGQMSCARGIRLRHRRRRWLLLLVLHGTRHCIVYGRLGIQTTAPTDIAFGLAVELTERQELLVASLDMAEEVARRLSGSRDQAVAAGAGSLYGAGRLLIGLYILIELTIKDFRQCIRLPYSHGVVVAQIRSSEGGHTSVGLQHRRRSR